MTKPPTTREGGAAYIAEDRGAESASCSSLFFVPAREGRHLQRYDDQHRRLVAG